MKKISLVIAALFLAQLSFSQQKGIPENRFQLIDGKGQNEPVADNGSESGKSKNRRVVITFLK